MSADASALARLLAWSVHLYTALGAPIALAAILATLDGDVRAAFFWMSLAVAIDASDGALARAARVKEVVPTFDGARLDDIVDYLNYVVVPVFFAVHRGLLPEGHAVLVGAAPLLASGYGFCQTQAKTADFFFTGFPSYWNIAVFYMYVFGQSPALNAIVLLGLSVLVFVPIGYLYPSRNLFLRPLTIALGVVWGVQMLVAIWQLPEPEMANVWASLGFPVYYFALSFYLHWKRSHP